MSLVAAVLEKLLEKPVKFLDDCVGEAVEKECEKLSPGDVILLENVRFHVEEEGKGVDADGKKTKATEEDTKKFRYIGYLYDPQLYLSDSRLYVYTSLCIGSLFF